jgi:hypothetical protein
MSEPTRIQSLEEWAARIQKARLNQPKVTLREAQEQAGRHRMARIISDNKRAEEARAKRA